MLKRTLVFSNPTILSLSNQQIVIAYKDSPDEKLTVPIEDIGVVLLENHAHLAEKEVFGCGLM